jgi:predicted AlkP superfamily phosphohydrolase/phosphomutase
MKLLVIGLDGATPQILFADERLTNFRRLMEAGCWGRLETIIPPITVPAWMCMATSQDPGSLGVYGFRNRRDRSYDRLAVVSSRSLREVAVWDQVAREGGRATIIGVPPSYPPRKVNGISVGCFLTPDPARDQYTLPPEVKDEIAALVGDYPVDVKDFRTDRKDWLRDEIHAMTRKHFEVVRHYLQRPGWDYFHFVEIGLDRLQHGFWKYHDPEHVRHEPGSPWADVISEYYLSLDHEVGRLLELLDDDTAVLVVSDHGARRLDGGFCVNQWLVDQGLLALGTRPRQPTPFAELDVDWDRTRVWSEGGYYARVFLNVRDREPRGTIAPADYDRVRDDLRARLEALTDDRGRPMGTRVFKPEEIYRSVRNVAPDLIVHFGDLAWRSIGSVGHPSLHLQENDTGPDDCSHAQHGVFILAAPGLPLHGALEGAHVLDIAPTLLELAGYDVPASMQGRSLIRGLARGVDGQGATVEDDEIVRERLRALGYIS